VTNDDFRRLICIQSGSGTHREFLSETAVNVDDHCSPLQHLVRRLLASFVHRPQLVLGVDGQLAVDLLVDELRVERDAVAEQVRVDLLGGRRHRRLDARSPAAAQLRHVLRRQARESCP